jgi:glycine cleavage system H protein
VSTDIDDALRFSTDHCWARLDPSGGVTVGLTDFAQGALGKIVFADPPEVGAQIGENEPLGEVESTKAVSELYAPVGGTVVAANSEIRATPGLINSDPYGAGWLCTIEPADPGAFGRLLDASHYAELIDDPPESEPSTND